ncbi:MAG: hypothetical protein GVY30_12380 [Chloroflexi bacterium]|jgi:hypothetical protein|nr:hypothetical protein [Chloroflexota bacterium]
MIYQKRPKSVWGGIWIVVLLGLLGCGIPQRLGWLPTPVPMTPTPHYAPMTGQAYIAPGAERSPLWDSPSLPWTRKATVAVHTQVDILDAVWFYSQGRFEETMCYMYRVRVPSDPKIEGWIEQDGLTQTYGEKVPFEERCFRGGQPTPTPPYAPLSGSVYVTVGEGLGVVGSRAQDPRQYIEVVFAHGVQVDIMNSFWVRYEATEDYPEISCYMYSVIHPGSLAKAWLPGEVLTKDLSDTPQGGCFSDPALLPIYEISTDPPQGFDVVTPEADLD